MSRVETQGHFMRCLTLAGADPDECRCDEEDAYSGRDRPSGGLPPREDAGCKPPWKRQTIAMSQLWQRARVTRRPDRLHLTGVLLDRAVGSSNELTVGDADSVLTQMRELDTAGRLQAWAAETLAGRAAG